MNDYNGIMGFAMSMLQKNPNVANSPQAQEMLRVLQSNDAQRGQEIARNLCQTYGVTPEQAINQATSFFNLPLGGSPMQGGQNGR